MDRLAPSSLPPRKSATQARSRATVEALFEATVQVLLADGPARLTTARVVQRAGVSIGSLYQYYPNKRSLLFAVFHQQIEKVANAVEVACDRLAGKPLATMVDGLVSAYVTVKFERVDVSLALYAAADTIDTADLIVNLTRRTETAVAAMLTTAPDARIADPDAAAFMVMGVISGVTRAGFERGDIGDRQGNLQRQLGLMCLRYLKL